jgi:hypothetical protein
MKRILIGAISFAALSTVASASIFLEYDNEGYSNLDAVGTSQGFLHTDAYIVSQAYYDGYGNTYPFPSQDKAIYNGYGAPVVSISSADDFDFVGGFFASWGSNDDYDYFSSASITIEGWDDGNLVGTVTKGLYADGFRYVAGGFSSIDTLLIKNDTGDYGRWWVGDSLQIEQTVPEPASMAVLGLGLAAVARRRRNK